MHGGLPKRIPILLHDSDDLRRAVGYISSVSALVVAVLNIVSLMLRGHDNPLEILRLPRVSVLLLFVVLAFATANWKSRAAEWIQVLAFLFGAFFSASESKPGDLTSALMLIFGLILAVEYNFERKALVACTLLSLLPYPIVLARSFGSTSPAYLSQAAAAMLALLFFVSLYGAVALRRRTRLKDEAERLEGLVRERTAELEGLLAERAAMLNEIHHRVLNNLQLVASLLHLESARIDSAELRSYFDAGVRRIDALALVHDSLYKTDRLDLVDFGDYARRLVDSLSGETGFRIEFVQEGEVHGPLESAVPFGLLLHELATNAERHAFPDGGGMARVRLAARGREVELEVADEGIGMGEEEAATRQGTGGLELAQVLVRQLRGSRERLRGPGTAWLVRFPLPESREGGKNGNGRNGNGKGTLFRHS